MLEISILGGVSVKHDGESVTEALTREAATLLIYLARVGLLCSRKALAELMREDQTYDRAMSSLSQTLDLLRAQFGDSITVTRDTAGLNPAAGLWLDVAELEEKLRTGELEAAIRLYKGPFLDGFGTREGRAFDEWIVQQRKQVHEAVLDALEAQAAHQVANGDFEAAIPHMRRLLDLDALPERVAWQARLLAALLEAADASRSGMQSGSTQDRQTQGERERTLLMESEKRYRSLFDGVPVGLYRTTLAGQVIDANLAQVQMLGFPSRDALLAAKSSDFYANPEERALWQALMEREGVVRDFQVQFCRLDGTVIWVNDSARAVKDEHGLVQYYEGSLEDITARKQAEAKLERYREHLEELVQERTAELRASEERYRTLFDGVPVGLYRTTPEGRLVDANRALVEMTGFPGLEEMLAANGTISFYVDPEQRLRWMTLMEREGIVRDFEFRHRRYDGTTMWVKDTARAVRDPQGKVLYYEGTLEDITERRGLEKEVRRQKDYYEALFVNSPVAVVTADLKGVIISWNPMAEKLLGYGQEEAIGRDLDDLVANDTRLRAEARAYTDQVINVGRVQATTRRTRKDGSLVDVELLALPVVVAGEKVGFIVIYVDITDLLEARRQAEAASEAKGAFLANVSHELRTPLNAILGFSQLMSRDVNLTADQLEHLGIINRSGAHLLSLINDVLEISKIEAGRMVVQERAYDLYRQLDGLEEIFTLRAQEKGLALTISCDRKVPQHIVGDERKLGQVLSNLLSNAVKFTDSGSVALRATVRPALQPADPARRSLHFEVEDTGPGIAPNDLPTIFDAFVQLETGRRAQGGTGLGLTISREFVSLMGGELTASSELGRGSCFEFDVEVGLPSPEGEAVHEAPIERRVVGLEAGQPTLRLLVVDENENSRLLLVRLLRPIGFEVEEATNGEEAFDVWQRWEPHAILMDMRMPVMDGYEATRRIKATPRGATTLIVAVSASAFEEEREKILSIGCDDFLRKPFQQQQVFDILSKHLGVRFIYEEVEAEPYLPPMDLAALPDADAKVAERLAALPSEWVSRLQQAVILGEWATIGELIERIRERDAELGQALAALARQFEHDKMLRLLRQAGGEA